MAGMFMEVRVLGVRHHGPGCARCIRQALDELKPDAILLEGPADAQEALNLAGHADLKPPVALALFPPDSPLVAAFFPFAEFSPEWQVIRWAAEHQVRVRFMDLPQSIQMAIENQSHADSVDEKTPQQGQADEHWQTDPLAILAEAAGYTDHELWWEEQIERRQDAGGIFEGILEAMTAIRNEFPERRPRDLLREAHMRHAIRDTIKQGHRKVAVVCGAWHAPVLTLDHLLDQHAGWTGKEDAQALKGLPSIKTTATWIPWTFSRLAYSSGYGAGVASPGWYAHLWSSRERAPILWMSQAAQLLRRSDLDAPSASVIEAVRLADALAAIRELRAPGLAELNEAILTVLCRGDATPMSLIRRTLEIGDVLGGVPANAPTVPLARDLERLQKTLRFKPSPENKLMDLDVRKENDREKSRLLHRLTLLGIDWGVLESTGGRVSTFHEVWRTEWKPEFAVAVIEANVWGNTVESAASARAVHRAQECFDLPKLTELLDAAMLASLPSAVEKILAFVQEQSTVGADLRRLMDALPALARVIRYGDVRGTQAGAVIPIVEGMLERILVGLPNACSALDDDAADQMLGSMQRVSETLNVLSRDDFKAGWHDRLRTVMMGEFNGLLRGWCCRSLLEQGLLDHEELYRITSLSLSSAVEPKAVAGWLAGLLRGSGLLLLHQDGLWGILDRWLSELSAEVFTETLPLLRRAFSHFQPPERRQMGEKIRKLSTQTPASMGGDSLQSPHEHLDWERVQKVVPILAHILGAELEDQQ
jgi:hypothetical protein